MIPEDTRLCPNVVVLLVHRLRGWACIKATLGQRLLSSGILHTVSLVWPSDIHECYTVFCKAKRQYLLNLQVGRYCFLALHGDAHPTLTQPLSGLKSTLFQRWHIVKTEPGQCSCFWKKIMAILLVTSLGCKRAIYNYNSYRLIPAI